MVARMKVSGTARPTVAPAPCGLMLTARLAPIAAIDSEIAPQVVSVLRRAGACEPAMGSLVAVITRPSRVTSVLRRKPRYGGTLRQRRSSHTIIRQERIMRDSVPSPPPRFPPAQPRQRSFPATRPTLPNSPEYQKSARKLLQAGRNTGWLRPR